MLLEQGRPGWGNPVQSRVPRRAKNENGHHDDRRGKDRDDRHRQIKFFDVARRLVVRAAATATVVVVIAGSTRHYGLAVIVLSRCLAVMVVPILVPAMLMVRDL